MFGLVLNTPWMYDLVHNILEPYTILAQIPFTKTKLEKFYMEYKKFYIQPVSPAVKHTYDLES